MGTRRGQLLVILRRSPAQGIQSVSRVTLCRRGHSAYQTRLVTHGSMQGLARAICFALIQAALDPLALPMPHAGGAALRAVTWGYRDNNTPMRPMREVCWRCLSGRHARCLCR